MYQCEFSGFVILLQLCKLSLLGEGERERRRGGERRDGGEGKEEYRGL